MLLSGSAASRLANSNILGSGVTAVLGLMGNKCTSSEDGLGYLQQRSLKAIITHMSLARLTVGFGRMTLITGVWVFDAGSQSKPKVCGGGTSLAFCFEDLQCL